MVRAFEPGQAQGGVDPLHGELAEAGDAERLLEHAGLAEAERSRLSGERRRELGPAAGDRHRDREELVALGRR